MLLAQKRLNKFVPPLSPQGRLLRWLMRAFLIFLRPGHQIHTRDFDASFYLTVYPDVAASGMDPYVHYVLHGRSEGRLPRMPEGMLREGSVAFQPSRETILVVSHDASRTGAPMLALNLVQIFQLKYNVVSLCISDGALADDFRRSSVCAAGPVPKRFVSGTTVLDFLIGYLEERYHFKFALVNSIVSVDALPALARHFIPTITLVHEFAAYTPRPREAFLDTALWSHEFVFSTPITRDAATRVLPELGDFPFHVIPQGFCALPSAERTKEEVEAEDARLLRLLRPQGLPKDTVVIIGIGTVSIRKGVDLFAEVASRIERSRPGLHVRYVWIGEGYDPVNDLGYSAYLAEQIHRSGLEGRLSIIGDTPNLETVYRTADVLLLSSRLDPLPNVAIDAMMHELPLLCFEKATGIADILAVNGLDQDCVAPHVDAAAMAEKVLALIKSTEYRRSLGGRLRQVALREFRMEDYVARLESLALSIPPRIEQEKADIARIEASGIARIDFLAPRQMSTFNALRTYVRGWASGVRRRKPFPGFHPGVFQEGMGLSRASGDPLVQYLRAGKPAGPWLMEVITAEQAPAPLPEGLRVAMHLHVDDMERLLDFLSRLGRNRAHPDLLVSVAANLDCDAVQHALLEHYSGRVVEIKKGPSDQSSGGQLLGDWSAAMLEAYDILGFFRTRTIRPKQARDGGRTRRLEFELYNFLLENLIGGRTNMADVILGHLAADPTIGLAFPDDPNLIEWGRAKPFAQAASGRLGIDRLPGSLNGPPGLMFWSRPKAIRPILHLASDGLDEPLGPYDGEVVQTALQMLLPLVVSREGFRSVVTNVEDITTGQS